MDYRWLTPEDKPAYFPSILELVEEESRHADSLIKIGKPSFYELYFTSDGAICGAIESGRLRGFSLFGFAPLIPSLWTPYIAKLGTRKRDCGIVSSMVVHRDDCSRGIGSSMYRMVISYAKEKNLKYLFAMNHPDNTGTSRMHSKYSFSIIDRLDSYKDSGPRMMMFKSLEP